MYHRWLNVFVLATGILFITSCGGGPKQAATSAPVASKIQITSATPTLLLGKPQQLIATVTFSDGSTQNSPSGITWSSSNNSIATVSATGVVTPVALGNVTISAALNSLSGGASLTVQTVLATLDRSTGVAGTDANGNGVRDDIDQVIAGFALSPNQTKAATQYAAALQTAALNTVDSNSAFNNAVEIQRGQECMAQQIGPGYTTYARQLRAFTFNTQQRVMAYINFEHNIGGTVFPRITGTICK
jgi:hypothetical protein